MSTVPDHEPECLHAESESVEEVTPRAHAKDDFAAIRVFKTWIFSEPETAHTNARK